MSFYEFLEAISEIKLLAKTEGSLANYTHEKLWQLWRIYLLVGGLPEAISQFIKYQASSLHEMIFEVRKIQNYLVASYIADMAKHSGQINAMHLERIWQSIPIQLNRDSGDRFKFKGLIPGKSRYSEMAFAIDWLEKAGLVYKVPILDTTEQPLSAHIKENYFKLFIFDCGILNCLMNLDAETILRQEAPNYKGFLAESFVLQELKHKGHRAVYNWKNQKSEIDFMLQYKGNVVPIEVKSGENLKAKSLSLFMKNHPEVKKAYRLSGRISNESKLARIQDLALYQAQNILNSDF